MILARIARFYDSTEDFTEDSIEDFTEDSTQDFRIIGYYKGLQDSMILRRILPTILGF